MEYPNKLRDYILTSTDNITHCLKVLTENNARQISQWDWEINGCKIDLLTDKLMYNEVTFALNHSTIEDLIIDPELTLKLQDLFDNYISMNRLIFPIKNNCTAVTCLIDQFNQDFYVPQLVEMPSEISDYAEILTDVELRDYVRDNYQVD